MARRQIYIRKLGVISVCKTPRRDIRQRVGTLYVLPSAGGEGEENEPVTQMELAAKIKAAAKERGVKLSYVAEQVGLSKQQFSDMLHCRKIIRAEYMPDIATAIGVAVGALYMD